jgi:hypothetical protein
MEAIVSKAYDQNQNAAKMDIYEEFRQRVEKEDYSAILDIFNDPGLGEREKDILLSTLKMRELEWLLENRFALALNFFLKAPIHYEPEDKRTEINAAWETVPDCLSRAGCSLCSFSCCTGYERIVQASLGILRGKHFSQELAQHIEEKLVSGVMWKLSNTINSDNVFYQRQVEHDGIIQEYSFLSYICMVINNIIMDSQREFLRNKAHRGHSLDDDRINQSKQKKLDTNEDDENNATKEACKEDADFYEDSVSQRKQKKLDTDDNDGDSAEEIDSYEEDITVTAEQKKKAGEHTLKRIQKILDEYSISREYLAELDSLVSNPSIAMPLFVLFLLSNIGYVPGAIYDKKYKNTAHNTPFKDILKHIESIQEDLACELKALKTTGAVANLNSLNLPGKYGILHYVKKRMLETQNSLSRIREKLGGSFVLAKEIEPFSPSNDECGTLLNAVMNAINRNKDRLCEYCEKCYRFASADKKLSDAAAKCNACKSQADPKIAHKLAIIGRKCYHNVPQGCSWVLYYKGAGTSNMLECSFARCRLTLAGFRAVLDVLNEDYFTDEIERDLRKIMVAYKINAGGIEL